MRLAASALGAITVVAVLTAGTGYAQQWADGQISPQIAQTAQTAAAPATAMAPQQTVETLHGALLGVMQQADSLGFDGRRAALSNTVPPLFDFAWMARIASGPHWGGMDIGTRRQLVDALARMTIATYADRFHGYNGEQFTTLGMKPGPKGTQLVMTNIVKSDGEAVRLDYLTRKRGEGWQIIDIFVKGSLSELATKRSEYTSVIKKRGVDALINEIDQKILDLVNLKR